MQNETIETIEQKLGIEKSDEPVNVNVNVNVNKNGVQRLVVAIIKQAVQDIALLKDAGVIIDGKMSENLPKDKRGNPIMPRKVGVELSLPEARDTLNFFKDENISVLLRLGGIEIEPCRFRAKLGLVA